MTLEGSPFWPAFVAWAEVARAGVDPTTLVKDLEAFGYGVFAGMQFSKAFGEQLRATGGEKED